jgi:hypothetical protein
MMLGDYVYPSIQNNRVYISVEDDLSWIMNLPNVNAMYITNPTQTIITSVDTGTEYTLQPGMMNDLYAMGLKSGFYDLTPNCGYISPNLMPSFSSNGMVPTTGFVLYNGSTYALGFKAGEGYRIINSGIPYDVDTVSYAARFTDFGGVVQTLTADMTGSLDAYSQIWSTYESLLVSARNSANLTWSLLDALEVQTGSYIIRPSMITSNLNPDLNLPESVQLALMMTAMKQLALMGVDAEPANIMISRESLEDTVLCYGNVYYQGILIAENAVYTPVFYTAKEKVIHTGHQQLTEIGTAFLIVYAVNVPNIGVFVPDMTQFTILDLTGDVTDLDIFEIWVNGAYKSSYKLEVLSAQSLGYFDFGFYHRPAISVMPSTVNFWMGLAIFFAGLSVLLAGMLFGGNALLLILGAIIMVLGILQVTTGLVTTIINMVSGFFSTIMGFFDRISNPFGMSFGGYK